MKKTFMIKLKMPSSQFRNSNLIKLDIDFLVVVKKLNPTYVKVKYEIEFQRWKWKVCFFIYHLTFE